MFGFLGETGISKGNQYKANDNYFFHRRAIENPGKLIFLLGIFWISELVNFELLIVWLTGFWIKWLWEF
jgi:hypothetical protein